eukprot:Phypoly_transcript_11139.p1 GENE.Phypoly_transcript_11139~~Phypoly_transcript_11139.p1  ORF type:complete len:140 (-),score=7.12 Phypoly_transcript_11139:243-662(-)
MFDFYRNQELVHWESLWAIVFDISTYMYHSQPFEVYSLLISSLISSNPFGIVAPRIICKNTEQLEAMVCKILDDSGEGLILCKFGSSYEPGRSENLLKLKGTNPKKKYHGRSLFQAVVKLSPNIGIEKRKLHASYVAGK